MTSCAQEIGLSIATCELILSLGKEGRMTSIENTSSADSVTSTQPEDFDLVILGGGTGSTVAAWTFAAEGKRVAVIDRKYIGGSCPNIACLPSKNIIHSAKVVSYVRNSQEFGIAMNGFTLDMSACAESQTQNGFGPE